MTAPDDPSDDGPDEAPLLPMWALVRTAHLAARAYADVFDIHGLSPAQFGVLACLADGDDLSQADLARTVLVRPQSMARLVTDMVGAGLVERVGPGGRGRRTGLALTAHGRRVLDRARPAAFAFDQGASVGLSDKETAQLVSLLGRVSARLRSDADAKNSEAG